MSYNDLIVLASGKDCIAHHNRTASKLGIPEEKIPNEPPKTSHTPEHFQDHQRINKTIQEFKNKKIVVEQAGISHTLVMLKEAS